MKRTTRLSIEFQHREVSVTVQGAAPFVRDREPEAPEAAPTCPVCGSPWLNLAATTDGDVPYSLDTVHRTLQRSGLHMQVSPAGQLQLCRQSFEQLKEKL